MIRHTKRVESIVKPVTLIVFERLPSIITGKGKDRANRKGIAAFNLDDHLETKIFRRTIPKEYKYRRNEKMHDKFTAIISSRKYAQPKQCKKQYKHIDNQNCCFS